MENNSRTDGRWVYICTEKNNIGRSRLHKICLLGEESVRNLYEQRLHQHPLDSPTEHNIQKEWQHTKRCIGNAAQEALNKNNKLRNRKGLRMWHDNTERVVKEKQKVYNHWLQKRTYESIRRYTEKRMRQSRLSGNAINSHGISS